MQALGWLSLFLATHGLSQGEQGWNDRIADWMVLWEADAHNKFWRGQWMLMFAQVAKHDTQGLETTSTTFLHLFNVNAKTKTGLSASAMLQPTCLSMSVTNLAPLLGFLVYAGTGQARCKATSNSHIMVKTPKFQGKSRLFPDPIIEHALSMLMRVPDTAVGQKHFVLCCLWCTLLTHWYSL